MQTTNYCKKRGAESTTPTLMITLEDQNDNKYEVTELVGDEFSKDMPMGQCLDIILTNWLSTQPETDKPKTRISTSYLTYKRTGSNLVAALSVSFGDYFNSFIKRSQHELVFELHEHPQIAHIVVFDENSDDYEDEEPVCQSTVLEHSYGLFTGKSSVYMTAVKNPNHSFKDITFMKNTPTHFYCVKALQKESNNSKYTTELTEVSNFDITKPYYEQLCNMENQHQSILSTLLCSFKPIKSA